MSRARFAAPEARTLDMIEHAVTLASVDEVAALFACDASAVDDDRVPLEDDRLPTST